MSQDPAKYITNQTPPPGMFKPNLCPCVRVCVCVTAEAKQLPLCKACGHDKHERMCERWPLTVSLALYNVSRTFPDEPLPLFLHSIFKSYYNQKTESHLARSF